MLSDACFEFSLAIEQGQPASAAAAELARNVARYTGEPWDYGAEIEFLRTFVNEFLRAPSPWTEDHLLDAAKLVRIYHDSEPTGRADFTAWVNKVWLPLWPDDAG